MYQGWDNFANFFGNLFNDPIAAIIREFEGLADSVLSILHTIAKGIDAIFGSNLASAVQGWREGLASKADDLVAKHGNGTYEEKSNMADQVDTLLSNGSISFKEAGDIVNGIMGGNTDGLNGIIHNLVENGKLTSSEAANISSAINSKLESNTSDLKDVVSNYGKQMNDNLTTINDSLKELKSLLGDINGDLVVNVRDAAALANALSTGNTDTLSSNADFNGDGKIDVRDTAAIARYLATLAPKSYATGVKNLSKDQLAWTQENGGLEYIIRPSDGAILTPLAKNDSVLNASASSNLWSVANNPEQFIRDNLGLSAISAPTIQKSAENTYNGDMNFSVTLPNVQNYEQFKYAMQRDKSFERFIRSVSVDRLFGKSSISKYKT
jgi:polyhydroxyalkanoate synthesis regulator phasin